MFANRTIRTGLLITLAALPLAACGSPEEADGAADPGGDEVASTSSAITVLNHCAVDPNANAQGTLAQEYSSDQYTRTAQQIATCKANNSYHPTTIVNFWAHGVLQFYYTFQAIPTWPSTPTTLLACAQTKVAMRVQRRNVSTGAWEQVDYQEKAGTWNPLTAKCSLPAGLTYTRLNQKDYYNTETNMYRVRAQAKLSNGNDATIKVAGYNIGN